MNGRELVILLLGLAIVAVVLRGLYVAINARRGQIKLAIDKNIPQNVDLESLELAELPGGGARVVTRSLEEVNRQNNALDLAQIKAKSLNLTAAEDDGHIPVLMDAVELSQPAVARVIPQRESQQETEVVEDLGYETVFAEEPAAEEEGVVVTEDPNESFEEEVEEDFNPDVSQEHSIGEDWDEDETEATIEGSFSAPQVEHAHAADNYTCIVALRRSQVEHAHAADNEDDPDSELFDYADEEELVEEELRNNVDTMSSVAPDYAEEAEVADEVEALSIDSTDITDSIESAEDTNNESYEVLEEGSLDVDLPEQAELNEQELTQEQEQEEPPALFDADSSVDEFSMTAGERIGGKPPSIDEANQSGFFDDIENNSDAAEDEPKSSRSLFSLFGRRSKQKRESLDDEQHPVSAVNEMKAAADYEPDDVLLEEERGQGDIEEFEHEEPALAERVVDEAIIDELDQKRAASLEIGPEEQKTHSDELEHSEVLVLNVTAKDGRVFSGDDLLQVLITSGLKFGDMNIFHKRLSKEHQGSVIFSVANMLNPGTFDLNNMDEFTTLGISFFLALPTPINNLDAFEQMLGVAQEIRDTLVGDLKDDHRNAMTGQTIEHYRQRIRDFELRRLKAVAARS